MRNLRVWVRSGDGRQFMTKALEISASRAVLRGEHVLPGGMLCDLQVVIPAADETKLATTAGLQAEVGHAVFAAGDVRLECRVVSLRRGQAVDRIAQGLNAMPAVGIFLSIVGVVSYAHIQGRPILDF